MKLTLTYVMICTSVCGVASAAPAKPAFRKPAGPSKLDFKVHPRFVPGAYIVELKGDHVVAGVARTVGGRVQKMSHHTSLVEEHRSRVAREQATLRPALEAKGARVLGSVDLVMNAIFVKHSGTAMELAALPGVKHVYPVRIMRQHLDRAVALTQVSDVWNRIGGSANAGVGMKIGILDEGIDISHPGFSDAGFKAPSGYPKSDTAADLVYTNNKVIVARSYSNAVSLAVDGYADFDPTVQDHSGHGTALAMVAAGVTNSGLYGTITGVSPGAYLGVYRIWNTNDDTTTDQAILAAINDSVSDGMDIINLSLGSIYAPRFDQDPTVAALEAAYQAGTLSVVSAGNDGPDFTSVASPSTAPHAISVGASTNDRAFGPAVWAPYVGTFGGWNVSGGGWVVNSNDGPAPTQPVTAQLVDANTLGNGLGCSAFDSRVSGKIVLIGRGSCDYSVKIANAQAAGAVAALVFDTQADTDLGNFVQMTISPATLPAQAIDYYSAQFIAQQLALTPFSLTMAFNLCGDASYATPCPFSVTPNLLTGFSSVGPGVDLGIKPDVLAPGENLVMATQRLDQSGALYDASGYFVADGTSFSSPFIAGVAALIKSARPGLTLDQYRSLVINTANSVFDPKGNYLSNVQTGSGVVNALRAYQSPVVAAPVSLGLGIASANPQVTQSVTLTNIGLVSDTYSLSAQSIDGVLSPVLPSSPVSIGAGQSKAIQLQFNGSNLAPGAYQGSIVASSATTGLEIRIPYWLDVQGVNPGNILLLGRQSESYRNRTLLDAFDFRLTDLAGAPMTNVVPTVTVVSGGGKVLSVNSADGANANVAVDSSGNYLQDIPGLWTVDVVLGASSGDNVFQVSAGGLSMQIVITGCRGFDFFGSCVL